MVAEANPLPGAPGDPNNQFLTAFAKALVAERERLGGVWSYTVDIHFLAFLRMFSRFGLFQFGPVSIETSVIEEVVQREIERRNIPGRPAVADDLMEFTRAVIAESHRSGRKQIDEMHYLLAFMRCKQGIPARVFGELGVSPEQVEAYAAGRSAAMSDPEKLYSPEEAADYLGVHVQTVRSWIRSGRLRASRLAGQRALRIRASDLQSVLEPVEPGDV